MDLNLKDKAAIVTGGNKGFGAVTAGLLAGEGARVLIAARNEQDLSATAQRIDQAHGVKVETLSADLTQTDGASKIATAALEAFGRIDILVNCAGASLGGVFWDIPDQVWQDSLDLKLMGTVRMIRAVLPAMREQSYGRIVTIAGNTGKQPHPRMLPGSAANAALLAVNTGLAQEVAADGIVLMAVNPGPSRTERWNKLMKNLAADAGKTVVEVEAGIMADIPQARLGDPKEIARLCVYLCSDVAGNMTGTSVTADGGWTKALS
jgi:NAD(P)-dependent dehydrogenase (short-subunit alcohol dehydrogenase family)